MRFLRKLFNNISEKTSKEKKTAQKPVNLSLDDSFVHHFIEKGGKFLYVTQKEEVLVNLKNILLENNWETLICNNKDLGIYLANTEVKIETDLKKTLPLFTPCEHLIADSGDILFSSNQLQSNKLVDLTQYFIVFATTSQLVKNMSEGLTGIKAKYGKKIPTNISAVKSYTKKQEDDFMSYGNTNFKNLYLLLLEDL